MYIGSKRRTFISQKLNFHPGVFCSESSTLTFRPATFSVLSTDDAAVSTPLFSSEVFQIGTITTYDRKQSRVHHQINMDKIKCTQSDNWTSDQTSRGCLACMGASLGGSISPASSPCVMMIPPTKRVLTAQDVCQTCCLSPLSSVNCSDVNSLNQSVSLNRLEPNCEHLQTKVRQNNYHGEPKNIFSPMQRQLNINNQFN